MALNHDPQERHARKRRRAAHDRSVSAFRIMWTIVMFDLPTLEEDDKRSYREFRAALLAMGFTMFQYSVYGRCSPSEEKADALGAQLQRIIPFYGQVRILKITDRQFAKMLIFEGKMRREPENAPQQLTFF